MSATRSGRCRSASPTRSGGARARLRAGAGGPRGARSPAVRPRLRRPPRTLLAAGAALVLLLAGWFWLRDSSLVAVRTVEVTGSAGRRARACAPRWRRRRAR